MMVRLTFPWSVLVPDNRRTAPFRGRQVLTHEYRQAKEAMFMLARMQYRGPQFRQRGLAIHAVLFVPDNRRRDPTNYAKMIQDALQGVVYVDDSQLDDCRYTRGGLDPANPRVEIVVRVADEVAA
jgi:Holliday junction resolvase RusA-like endonuclease